MRFRLTFITGLSLLFIIISLIGAFTGMEGFLGKRFFFTTVGILGWFIGHELVGLEDRLSEVEKILAEENKEKSAQ